jgi:hypothetical protein
MGESLNVYRVWVWKPKGNSPLGKPRRRWKNINKHATPRNLIGECTGVIWLRTGTSGGLLYKR